MLHIKKNEEPQFLSDFKKKYPSKTYDSTEFKAFRIPLNDVLRKEQKGLCAYCCAHITDKNAHNEHIEPQHPGQYASEKSLDYNNIVASCNHPKTCGRKKDNHYDSDKFVSPLDEDCETRFIYYPDGVIEGDDYTIDLLNLNDYELKNARKAVYKSLQNLDRETILLSYMNESVEEYPAFFNVIKWYLSTL